VYLCASAAAIFLAAASPAQAWTDYQIIEWQPRNAAQWETLKRLGVTAGTVIADRGDGVGTPVEQQTAPLRAVGLAWYVENIATDFYSAYHRWTPNHPVNWRFVEAQARYPNDPSALWRDPSLSDRVWQQRIDERLARTVHEQSRFHPLYYNLGDETGIADLSAFWDFDLSPASLADMRVWLRQRYSSLAALNAEWGTHFPRWDEVRPQTTRDAIARTDGNFASWGDFKAWMDVAFARGLRRGTDAVHRADPSALSAIEGAQLPGWGGYDYSLLVNAVDVMETDALPLAVSLNPRLVALTTSHTGTPKDIHAIWRALLDGSHGLILWDAKEAIVAPDGTLRERGHAYENLFAELRGGLAATLLASTPHVDPVAILYSPASFRISWLLEQQPHGDAWMSRDAEAELGPNAQRDAMRDYAQALTHIGLHPMYISPAMLANGALRQRHIKLLVLPHAIALSDAEVHAIHEFGGAVVGDTQPGLFDEHGRSRPQPPDVRMMQVAPGDPALASFAAPPIGIDVHDATLRLFHHGTQTIISVQRDFAEGATPEQVTLTLPRAADVYDMRAHKSLGRTNHVTLTLDAVEPALLSY
jgi:Beta-galactosidase